MIHFQLDRMLRTLAEHRIEFNLVGGVAGALHGAPVGLLSEDLIDTSDVLEVAGVAIHVLSLERLIELKRQLARPKDLAVLPVLEATLRERRALERDGK